jgi:hypothetical protein
MASRYLPIASLLSLGIPSVIWGEDALRHYGSRTIVFDLYLLVPDPEAAFRALLSTKKYEQAPPMPPDAIMADHDLGGRAIRVVSSPPEKYSTIVVLMSAKLWAYNLNHVPHSPNPQEQLKPEEEFYDFHFPLLDQFANSLLITWLKSPWSEGTFGNSWETVALWISYLYCAGVPELTQLITKNPERENYVKFARRLSPGARELHLALAKDEIWMLGAPSWREYRRFLAKEKESNPARREQIVRTKGSVVRKIFRCRGRVSKSNTT